MIDQIDVMRTRTGVPVEVVIHAEGAWIKWARRKGLRRAVLIIARTGRMTDRTFAEAEQRAYAILCAKKKAERALHHQHRLVPNPSPLAYKDN